MILNCFVLGIRVTFLAPLSEVVHIKNDVITLNSLTVDFFKKYIWRWEENILKDLSNDSSSLRLWNINVDEVKDENYIIQKLKSKEMKPHYSFSSYFKDEPLLIKISVQIMSRKCLEKLSK